MSPAQTTQSIEEGERLYSQGLLAGAQEIFESILHEDASSKEALNNLGVIAHLLGEVEKAFHYFMKALFIDPLYQDAVDNLCLLKAELKENLPTVERVKSHEILGESQAAVRTASESVHSIEPKYKIYYSPGITHHGENARRLLDLELYVPSLHFKDPVWFFGLYFDCDYHQLRAHVGKKIINWRGADTLRLVNHSERLRLIERTEALHVCQAEHQKEILSRHGIRSIVRPMMNTPFRDIRLPDFPAGPTDILVYWRRGDDRYIQADLFFEIAAKCTDIFFHVVGEEDPMRFQLPGINNILFHGFIPEDSLDEVMDQCKGTIRPWLWDGNPNIQTKMLLKGRYAAHSCRFEKVSHCTSVEEYVAWIEWLKGVEAPNLEAREWWMNHLNNFDFLGPGFDPAKQGAGEKG